MFVLLKPHEILTKKKCIRVRGAPIMVFKHYYKGSVIDGHL